MAEALAPVSRSTPLLDSAPLVCDLHVPYRPRILRLSLYALPVVFAVGFASAIASLKALSGGAAVAFMFCFSAVLDQFRISRIRRRLANLVDSRIAAATVDPQHVAGCIQGYADMNAFVANVFRPRSSVALEVATALARGGFLGRAVRLADEPQSLPAISPMETQFEPIFFPMYGRSAGSGETQQSWSARVRESFRTTSRVYGKSAWVRVLTFVGVLIGAVAMPFLVYQAVVDMLGGRMPEIIEGILWVLPFLGFCFAWQLWNPQEWFAVPGAILVRSARWRRSDWDLHLVTRDAGVLVYWPDLYWLAVARADGTAFCRRIQPVDAEKAIRAWLSPIRTPPIEQFSDLR